MKKLLLVGLLLGSFAFGQTIVTKKGSYCTGITLHRNYIYWWRSRFWSGRIF